MRFALSVLSLSLFTSLACQDKKFAGGTEKGTADAKPEVVKEEEAVTPEPEAPTMEIEFGTDEVFRIGDGTSGAQSACIGEVKSHDLKGTTYYFQFEVLEDDSKVEVSIGKLCGVDQANFTTVALMDESKNPVNPEIAVPIDASGSRPSPFSPLESQQLNKGVYSVVVTSKNTVGRASKSPDPNVDEYDDFVVGQIQVKSDKTVKQIKVFAE